ncbi:TrkH family potassium uptake protein [Alkalicoccus urumqiensis]|uniref:Ktr system potassium transporter B n=1 Tax=Alkalicoccus urumqiensis TaxID=1548213 RepID=A0A2P6MIH4_ALKUR|nr:TrkH family potassium uptake protein [Alkalicoccus urumqiensis]PRO66061.1 Ktr system potassium transporter B [Alkalicoccus urumqiensis]
MLKKRRPINPPQVLAAGFILSLFAGSLLLWLPVSVTGSIAYIDALFMAASAVTVTGLGVVDPGTTFTRFGQIVLMVLIQLGGLGFMSFAVLLVLALGKKLGLRERMLVKESFNQPTIGGMVRLAKMLLLFTAVLEGAGTVLLAIRWVPEYGLADGLFFSMFHAVSAFNNAGFSLWVENLTGYPADPLINSVISILFISGGIGFTVVYDLLHTKKFRFLSLHTKLMLSGTLVLNAGAALLFFALEYSNPETIGNLSASGKMWASYFQAVTPRTAGFNTIDISGLGMPAMTMMLVLMFIGAGSASTGSGIKLTTFLVIILAVQAYLRGKKEAVAFERRISEAAVTRALAVAVTSLLIVIAGVFLLSVTEQAPYHVLVFEVFSAFGTVGLSMGLTPELSSFGKAVVMLLMFIGRLGPLTLAFALARTEVDVVRYPKGEVFTG